MPVSTTAEPATAHVHGTGRRYLAGCPGCLALSREANRRRRSTTAGREAANKANRRRRSTPQGRAAYREAVRTTYDRLRARTKAEADHDFETKWPDGKPCQSCGELLPAEAFARNWTTTDGRFPRCDRNGCRHRHEKLKHSRKLRAHWESRGIDPHVCIYCLDAPASDLEHVMPKALGGTDDFSNLAPSCPACNRGPGGKHDTHPLTWLAQAHPERLDAILALFPHIALEAANV
ncbi:HNH endonuclease [Microbacterium aerolatum]|uniref:HNH endonuclease n=1 Tax=Microbacterium aerolatum TaxID=153731 RepID=UPI0035571B66